MNTHTVSKAEEVNNYNAKVIAERIERVRSLLQKSTGVWLDIAREVLSAKVELSNPTFREYKKGLDLSSSVLDKLLKIAACKPLYVEENLAIIASIDGWTVLYELAKLEDKKLQEVLEALRSDRSKAITRSRIAELVTGEPSPKLYVVASIEIDEAKLDRLTTEKLLKAIKGIKQLKDEIDALGIGFVLRERYLAIEQVEQKASANSAAFIVQSKAA